MKKPRKKRSEKSYRTRITELRKELSEANKEAHLLSEYKFVFLQICDSALSCSPTENVSAKYILTKMRSMVK